MREIIIKKGMFRLFNKSNTIQNLLKATLLLLVFVNIFTNTVFATSYEEANVVIGKNSSDKDEIYIEKGNITLDSIIKMMTEDDALTAYVYISEYRKGDKEMEDLLIDLISKYDPVFATSIAHYILEENYVRYLSTYIVKRPTYTIESLPIAAIANNNSTEMDAAAQAFWEKFKAVVPPDFYSDIDCIHFEQGKDPDNLITLCKSVITLGHWDMSVDMSLLSEGNEDTLWDYLMYATVYYYVLKDDQVEQLVETKGNYQYAGLTYKTDSFINKFYKKFWKDRRFETNTNQYELYKKEFLNRKASRTVYDDMAVSFVNYVKNGYMRRYLGFRADKTNFFDDYELFRTLAKTFRSFLGIKKLS